MFHWRPKHWAKLALRPDYRAHQAKLDELEHLRSAPRRTSLSSNVLGAPFEMVDGASFFASYQEIFENEIYAFKAEDPTPLIIDGGANTGVSVLYFKKLYPTSRIVAFEADPSVFRVLQSNVLGAGYHDVRLLNKALWREDCTLEFCVEGADAGRILREGDQTLPTKVAVSAVRLRPFLENRVDLLKLDIEGAETDVLLDSADLLGNVRQLFVEYHSFAHEEQRLDVLLNVIKTAGFRIYIQTVMCPPQPLAQRSMHLGMDLQLNIFGTRVP